MSRLLLLPVLLATVLLTGCELLGIESPERIAAAREADGKAIGGACRHAGRAIEDCYALNRKADRAAVFAGWRDMNDYMRENKIEPIEPQIATPVAGRARAGSASVAVPAEATTEVTTKGKGGARGREPAAAGKRSKGDVAEPTQAH